MQKNKKARDPLPKSFKTIDEFVKFWDSHSTADYPEAFREVKAKVNIKRRHYFVALRPRLMKQVSRRAEEEGISTETLINAWLAEKLREAA
ncbi:MAG: hypothetical protein HY868_14335 [Chloroflexi bacterium]|nr:hypothetical protein [Chloroflexota bacterium]